MSWGTTKNLFLSHLIKNFDKDISPAAIIAGIKCSSVNIPLTRIIDLASFFACSKTFCLI